jgi:hypothetical protein
MSSSGFYFNGRLYRTPTVVSRVDASGLANRNLSVGNILAILATSGGGGEPKTAVRFGSPAEAAAAGVNGYALKAIEMAFAPSTQTGGPAEIVFMRVNPATQSTGTVKNGSAATIINLASADYGLTTAQIKYKIESGTTAGSKLTTQKGNDYYTQDDVARNVFSVEYTGAEASARMSITGTTLTLEAPNATSVASIDLNIYDTAQKVVDRINVVTGFTAAVLDGYVDHATLNAVSPGLIAGSGLKPQHRPQHRRGIAVSPGLIAGSGLKPNGAHDDQIDALVSPGLIAGSGLKQGLARRPQSQHQSISRLNCREWIETLRLASIAGPARWYLPA